jgi:hypothetical protein
MHTYCFGINIAYINTPLRIKQNLLSILFILNTNVILIVLSMWHKRLNDEMIQLTTSLVDLDHLLHAFTDPCLDFGEG